MDILKIQIEHVQYILYKFHFLLVCLGMMIPSQTPKIENIFF